MRHGRLSSPTCAHSVSFGTEDSECANLASLCACTGGATRMTNSIGLNLPTGGTVNNKVTIIGTNAGISAGGNLVLTNSGTVSSPAGNAIEAYYSVNIGNTGLITGEGGINALLYGGTGSLTNGGKISATSGT